MLSEEAAAAANAKPPAAKDTTAHVLDLLRLSPPATPAARTLDVLDLLGSAPEQQRPSPPQPAVAAAAASAAAACCDFLDRLFDLDVTPAPVAPLHKHAGVPDRPVKPFANNPFVEEEEDMQSTSGREREMAARIELLEEKLAEAVEESAKRGEALRACALLHFSCEFMSLEYL